MYFSKDLYYFEDKNECDFIIKSGRTITQAIQTCFELNTENTERELLGLHQAMTTLQIPKGIILTYDQEKQLTEGKKTIHVIPVWKWLQLS